MIDGNYDGVLLEDIRGKLDAVLVGYKGVREEMKLLAKQADLEEVKQDVKTIRTVTTSTNANVKNLDQRVLVLEKATA